MPYDEWKAKYQNEAIAGADCGDEEERRQATKRQSALKIRETALLRRWQVKLLRSGTDFSFFCGSLWMNRPLALTQRAVLLSVKSR